MKKIYTGSLVFLLLAMMIFGNFQVVLADNQDSFGYTYKDSNTLEGPTYNWIEINQTGTLVLPSSGDWWFDGEVVDLEFVFEFYGMDYNQLAIGSKGMLFFEELLETWNYNEQIANSPDVHGFIAPYWDSIATTYWDMSFLGAVYCQTLGTAPNRFFVIEWLDVQSVANETSTSGNITFETVLYEGSNDILFQYKDVFLNELSWSNSGASATVGLEDQFGYVGLEYSFNQPVISSELAILFECPATVSGANLYASINSPASIVPGAIMTYALSYSNLGGIEASNVVLDVTLSPDVIFVSASEDGTYDSGIVTWNIGSVAEYPSGLGAKSVTVEIPSSSLPGDVIETSVYISTSTTETSIDDNAASVQTILFGLPSNIDLEGNVGDAAGTPTVRATTPLIFTYTDPDATSVDIEIQLNDDGINDEPDFSGSMIGPAPTWTYTVDFYPRQGDATAIFTAHHEITDVVQGVNFEVYIDPAGYIYDQESLERISGATVWLQRPNNRGGWENVPTGEIPYPIMQPDVNPQITGSNGRYQWDTLSGTYRVHVEAPGYYPSDSIAVTVPPPVTDLHVGLIRIPLSIENNSPEITSFSAPIEPLPVNTLVSVSANFIDADSYDKHTAIWTWADGSSSKGTVTEENGIGTVTGGHIYSTVGVYEEVTLFIADSNGGYVELDIPQYIVVYDPSAGFVTGGGWINSPEGAYTIDPELMGKATFGFVSRYQKGATVPTGNTAFEFKVAALKFHSTAYQWLVIAGAKAQYKGTGTINGEGTYKFMLTAIDGKLQSELTPDTFRIKIWDSETENIIYDNQLGLSDSLDPTTIIECGSIVIHK